MSSNALVRFMRQREEAFSLSDFYAINEMQFQQRQKFYHASLAAIVASWDSFVKELIREYFAALAADPDIRFAQLVSISRQPLTGALEKLNTPNFDNTRKLYIDYTGYDPILDWNWTKRSMNWQTVNAEVNSIFRIRHSFAHGFSLSALTITSGYSGSCLRKKDIEYTSALFQHLALGMDSGLANHATRTFGIDPPW